MALLCKDCAGTLIFDPEKQRLICRICGHEFAPEEVEESAKELLEEAGKLRDARIYVCDHCGSEIELNESESSSFCVYCGNPAIVFDRIAKTKRPDRIIPFKITLEEARSKVEAQLKKNHSLTKKQKDFETEKIRGIYIPYWNVCGKLYGSYEVMTDIGSDDNTHYVYTSITGTMDIDSLPVYGSDKLPEVSLNQIDFWNFDEAVPFDEEYLAGFYSDIADTDYDVIREKATARSDTLFKEKTRSRASGSFRKYTASSPVFEVLSTPEYILVPIWFITIDNHDGTRSTFMMNAQTGQSVGTFPVKFKDFFIGVLKKSLVAVILLTLFAVIGTFFFCGYLLTLDFWAFVLGLVFLPVLLIADLITLLIAYTSSTVNKDEYKTTEYSAKRKEA